MWGLDVAVGARFEGIPSGPNVSPNKRKLIFQLELLRKGGVGHILIIEVKLLILVREGCSINYK